MCGIIGYIGKNNALEIANKKHYEDVECIIIDKDYNIHLSNGLKKDGDYITLK